MSTKETAERRKGEITKTRLVEIAMDLFQRRGYAAVGLNELCAAGRVPKGSVYYHFPQGKTDIALAVVAQAQAQVGQAIELAGEAASGLEAFVGMLADGFAQNLTQSDFEKGCPVSTLALELSAQDTEIAAVISACFAHWQSVAAARLQAFGIDEQAASDKAEFCFCAIEGALILARTQRSLAPLMQVQRHLIACLKQDTA